MAANKKGNPIITTGAEVLWKGATKGVRLIQWIDDDAAITHDSLLTLDLGGGSFTLKIQPLANESAFGAVAYEAGPFNPGLPINYFEVVTMAHGELLVWLD